MTRPRRHIVTMSTATWYYQTEVLRIPYDRVDTKKICKIGYQILNADEGTQGNISFNLCVLKRSELSESNYYYWWNLVIILWSRDKTAITGMEALWVSKFKKIAIKNLLKMILCFGIFVVRPNRKLLLRNAIHLTLFSRIIIFFRNWKKVWKVVNFLLKKYD